jgi:hypothetical protein
MDSYPTGQWPFQYGPCTYDDFKGMRRAVEYYASMIATRLDVLRGPTTCKDSITLLMETLSTCDNYNEIDMNTVNLVKTLIMEVYVNSIEDIKSVKEEIGNRNAMDWIQFYDEYQNGLVDAYRWLLKEYYSQTPTKFTEAELRFLKEVRVPVIGSGIDESHTLSAYDGLNLLYSSGGEVSDLHRLLASLDYVQSTISSILDLSYAREKLNGYQRLDTDYPVDNIHTFEDLASDMKKLVKEFFTPRDKSYEQYGMGTIGDEKWCHLQVSQMKKKVQKMHEIASNYIPSMVHAMRAQDVTDWLLIFRTQQRELVKVCLCLHRADNCRQLAFQYETDEMLF